MPFERQTWDPELIRITANGWGPTKEGKTHWSWTFPTPIWYLNLDRDNRPLLRLPEFAGKEIYISDLFAEPDFNPNFAMTQLKRFHVDYVEALAQAKARKCGTLIIDPFHTVRGYIESVYHTAAIDAQRQAAEARDKAYKQIQTDWASTNAKTRQYVHGPLGVPGLNFVLLNPAKPVYDGGEVVRGQYEAQVWPEIPKLMDVSLHFYKDQKGKYMSTIESCGTNPKLVGLPQQNLTYEKLRRLLLGLDSEEDDD